MGGYKKLSDKYAIVEIPFLLGTDRRLIGCNLATRAVYLALWGLSIDEGYEQLPDEYSANDLQIFCRKLACDRRTLDKNLTILSQKGLINVDDEGRVTVYGASKKHDFVQEKKGEIKTKSPTNKIREDKIREDKIKEKSATPKTAPLDLGVWKPLFEIFWSIDATGYRTLKPDQDWLDKLDAAARRLGSSGRVVDEADSMKTWLLGQFDSGKQKRDKRHSPRSRFLNQWIPRAIKDAEKDGCSHHHQDVSTRLEAHAREKGWYEDGGVVDAK